MSELSFVDAKIGKFVDGGVEPLSRYTFCSKALEKEKSALLAKQRRQFALAAGPDTDGDKEQPVRFRLNQTGNIFYATTNEKLEGETRALFDSVTVLFSAMTRAMGKKGKTLFDYAAWGQMIRASGYFVEMQKFRTQLVIKATTVTVNTQIISQLLPGLTSGSSLEIAKGVLSSLNGEFGGQDKKEDTQLAHLLFICEEIMGAPSVTVRLFYASKKSHEILTKSPCHKSVSREIEQLQEANTFLFVSPETIAKFAEQFKESPAAYEDLIDRLEKSVDEPKPKS